MILVRVILFTFLINFNCYANQKLCSTVNIYSERDIEFSEVEKRLLCGDTELAAYKNIPAYQAKFWIQGFLQSKGYLNPRFEYEEGGLKVFIKNKTLVTKIQILPLDLLEAEKIKKELWQFFSNRVITPDLLTSMENELKSLIRQQAYACAELETSVDGSSGQIIFQLNNLKRFMFGPIDKEDQSLLIPNAIERFYPFGPNDPFNSKLLDLAEKRMVRTGVVQGTYFKENCSEDQSNFSLSQDFIFGPPRIVRFGIGVSSEVGPIARVRWSHNRFDEMASKLEGNFQASYRSQSLVFTAEKFAWPDSPRRSFISQLEILRESQVEYEETTLNLKFYPQWTRDFSNRFWQWSFGPTLMSGNYRTDIETQSEEYSAVAFEGDLLAMSHKYEFYDFHPQEGSKMRFHFDMRHPSLGFEERLLKLDFTLVALQPLWRWGRGGAVSGVRFNLATTSLEQGTNLDNLPPSVKYYGGGSDDIRGFPLQSLPENNGRGALSKLSVKFELRKTHFFKLSFEGFIFHDAGIFGEESWSLSPKLYQSPGFGFRWLSPIGLIQSFVANGYSNNPYKDHGEVFYVGMGGVF